MTGQSAEFDTVAEWTADAALDLSEEFYLPAACRGSGNPASMAWLLDALRVGDGDALLDCGAGVGGPAAFARESAGARPVLVEPETGACRAAQRLFGFEPVRATGERLPFADATFSAVWCLGMLCTTPDQHEVLAELCRILRPGGRLALLVYTATCDLGDDAPPGNYFPTEAELAELLSPPLAVTGTARTDDFAAPSDWRPRIEAVDAAIEAQHGTSDAWRVSTEHLAALSRLLDSGRLVGQLVVAQRGLSYRTD